MKTKILAVVVLSLLLAYCTTAPLEQKIDASGADTPKVVCMKYKPLELSSDRCFKALLSLVQQELLGMVYDARIDGRPNRVVLNLAASVWNKPEAIDESGVRVLALVLLTYKAFDDVKVVKVLFSDAPVMEFSLVGEDICVRNFAPEEPREPKETPLGHKYKTGV